MEVKIAEWTKDIQACLDIQELSRPLLLGLIDKIIVSEKGNNGFEDEQRIRIVYRFARKEKRTIQAG